MTTTTATKTRKQQTEIQSATVNRVIDKASKKVLGYLVKSDTQEGVYYQVTWDRENHRYNCTCPATKPCKHERAVSEVVKARKEIEAAEKQQAVAEAEKIVTSQPVAIVEAPVTIEPPTIVATATTTKPAIAATKPVAAAKAKVPTIAKRENAPLGSNKAFSLMR